MTYGWRHENYFRRGCTDGWTYVIQGVAGGPVKIGGEWFDASVLPLLLQPQEVAV